MGVLISYLRHVFERRLDLLVQLGLSLQQVMRWKEPQSRRQRARRREQVDFEPGRTIEVGLVFGEEGLPMVETSWIQPCLEPEWTVEVEVGASFGEEGPSAVEDSCG